MNSVELNPISAADSRPAVTGAPTARAAIAAALHPAIQDLIEIANVPALNQVEPLQTSNPTQFQTVLFNAIRQLREAEFQAADPQERAYLGSLADRFQQLQEASDANQPDLTTAKSASASA